jgi:hypothetical protein
MVGRFPLVFTMAVEISELGLFLAALLESRNGLLRARKNICQVEADLSFVDDCLHLTHYI